MVPMTVLTSGITDYRAEISVKAVKESTTYIESGIEIEPSCKTLRKKNCEHSGIRIRQYAEGSIIDSSQGNPVGSGSPEGHSAGY